MLKITLAADLARCWPPAAHWRRVAAKGPLPAEEAEVDAEFAGVIRKYGDRLSEDQRTRVRDVLARHERMLMRIRAFPLKNSDAPATSLRLISGKKNE